MSTDKVLPSKILIELQEHKLRLLSYLGQLKEMFLRIILCHKRVCSVSSYLTFESRSGFSAKRRSFKYLCCTFKEVFRFLFILFVKVFSTHRVNQWFPMLALISAMDFMTTEIKFLNFITILSL